MTGGHDLLPGGFGDVREKFIQGLLRHRRGGLSLGAITASEQKLLDSREDLFDINDILRTMSAPTTVALLVARSRGFLSVRDVLFLLLDAHDNGDLDMALAILGECASQRVSLTTAALQHVVDGCSCDGIPPSLAVAIIGQHEDGQ